MTTERERVEAVQRAGESFGYALEAHRISIEAFALGMVRGARRAQEELSSALEAERAGGSDRPEILEDGTLDPDLPSPHEVVADIGKQEETV